MTNIVFIGGTGRCGTNIMKYMLSLHPMVASHPFEYKFIIDPDGIIDFYTTATSCWSPYIINKKLRRLEIFLNLLAKADDEKKIYKGWELENHLPEYSEKCKNLIESLVDLRYTGFFYGLKGVSEIYFMRYRSRSELKNVLGDFIRDLISGYLEKTGKEVYVEDNTFNTLFVRELLELIPEAKIICMLRSPKDVISSLSKQRWAPDDKMDAAIWYKSVIDRWNAIRTEIPEESFMEVDLYQLVDDTENILKDVSEFVGLNYDKKMLDINLSKSNRDRWKDDFTEEENMNIEIRILKVFC